jgi:hypothetical protein
MSEPLSRARQFSLWQLFFWLTLGSIWIATAALSYRGQPTMSPIVGGLITAAIVFVYRVKRHRDDPRP